MNTVHLEGPRLTKLLQRVIPLVLVVCVFLVLLLVVVLFSMPALFLLG